MTAENIPGPDGDRRSVADRNPAVQQFARHAGYERQPHGKVRGDTQHAQPGPALQVILARAGTGIRRKRAGFASGPRRA